MAYTTIAKPNQYFNTKLYTGTGATQSISGVNFQPDLVWIKNRQDTYNHHLFDVIRGVEKEIRSDSTTAETTISGSLTSFDSDGFTLGSAGNTNFNGNNHVSWNWLAGGTGVSNTDGTITSTVSANTTSGFSIVTYTGTNSNETVGHGLGVAPSLIIARPYSGVSNWVVWHKSISITQYLFLNTTAALDTANQWQNTLPNSNVFYTSTGSTSNLSAGTSQIAYCFAEKKGFSKFGSYTGNGSEDGPFIYTGFAPAFVIIRITSATGDWTTYDNKRKIYNPRNVFLRPNNTNAEATSTISNNVDFLSNGFKPRKTNGDLNSTGNNYIYMAFAENPLVTTDGLPATAR